MRINPKAGGGCLPLSIDQEKESKHMVTAPTSKKFRHTHVLEGDKFLLFLTCFAIARTSSSLYLLNPLFLAHAQLPKLSPN